MELHGAEQDELTLKEQVVLYKGKMPLLLELNKLNVLKQLTHTRHAYELTQYWSMEIIKACTKEALTQVKTIEDTKKCVTILRDAYTYRGREDFESFLIAMEWNRPHKDRFYEPRQKVLQSVVKKMQDLAEGKLKLLSISMPPRAGKTTLGILYILWRAGREPNKSILSAGYSSSLVNSFYDGVSEFIVSEEYRFISIFPECPLISSSAKNLTLDLSDKRRYKSLTFRSIDGTVTGATEASELLYLDDLVSGIEEAMNINRLDGLWSKVTSDMLQRRKNGVPILIIGTRWSIHDPLGRIETEYENDSKTCFIKLPAINEKGESNIDYEYGVGYSTEHYKDLKKMTDRVTWECVYMQNPIERDGLLFEELKRFFELPQDKPDDILFFTDVAFGGADYLSMPIAYQYGDDLYVVDVAFLKGGYKETEPIVAGKIGAHNIKRGVFEANNGGDFYGRDVVDMIKKQGIHCNIKSERATGKAGKLARIVQHAPAIKEMYFRDSSLYRNDDMYGMFMSQVLSFTQTGKNTHDDGADSLAGLAQMIRKRTIQTPKFTDRRKLGL